MTNRERAAPPKLATCFAGLLIGSPGQILATVTAWAVERYEKPEFVKLRVVAAFHHQQG